jgi:endo-1,4-beta-D-glucanase Y
VFRPALATEFFDRYVDDDGRVVRRDQGSDTVSEGQAYAMLLAVALDDAGEFERVWQWTRSALQRPDGLLSWHWSGGRIADEQPAADADVDAAHALVLAADKFGNPAYLKEARRMAKAILESETVRIGRDRVLVPGPWARDKHLMNPSYIAPEAFDRFADAFGDDRWREVSRSGIRLTAQSTSDGTSMPPDWARIEPGRIVDVGPPDGNGMPSTGLDAARVLVRFASSCDDDARDLAKRLRGAVSDWESSERHPLQIVAAASAAHAAGDASERDRLLARAESVARERPSYYGWAWVALGRAMLDGRAISSCSGALDLGVGT